MKPRNPFAMHARRRAGSAGPMKDKRRTLPRKAKHKERRHEP